MCQQVAQEESRPTVTRKTLDRSWITDLHISGQDKLFMFRGEQITISLIANFGGRCQEGGGLGFELVHLGSRDGMTIERGLFLTSFVCGAWPTYLWRWRDWVAS